MREPAGADFGHAQSGGDAANTLASGIDQRFAEIAAANSNPEFLCVRDHARDERRGALVHTDNVRCSHEFLARVHESTARRLFSASSLAVSAAKSQA